MRIDDQGPSRHQDHDALRRLRANIRHISNIRRAQGQCGTVTRAFRVGCFANHRDANVAAIRAARVGADVLQCHVGRFGRLKRLPEGCACGGCTAAALPGDRPAAHLIA